MTETRPAKPTQHDDTAKDPVCGMDVVVKMARERGLTSRHAERDFCFCGRGCKLEFDDAPEAYLSGDHTPTM
jgi:YHS domain-containing protein